jgi:hypothetical protein
MSSAAQAVALGRGAHRGQRPFRRSRDQVGPGVESLQERIAVLVYERQRMRSSGASRAALERNRRQLVRSQWQLSQALIERHLPRIREETRAR